MQGRYPCRLAGFGQRLDESRQGSGQVGASSRSACAERTVCRCPLGAVRGFLRHASPLRLGRTGSVRARRARGRRIARAERAPLVRPRSSPLSPSQPLPHSLSRCASQCDPTTLRRATAKPMRLTATSRCPSRAAWRFSPAACSGSSPQSGASEAAILLTHPAERGAERRRAHTMF